MSLLRAGQWASSGNSSKAICISLRNQERLPEEDAPSAEPPAVWTNYSVFGIAISKSTNDRFQLNQPSKKFLPRIFSPSSKSNPEETKCRWMNGRWKVGQDEQMEKKQPGAAETAGNPPWTMLLFQKNSMQESDHPPWVYLFQRHCPLHLDSGMWLSSADWKWGGCDVHYLLLWPTLTFHRLFHVLSFPLWQLDVDNQDLADTKNASPMCR